MNPNTPVITSGARTAIGAFMGAFAAVPAPALAAHVLKANLERSQVDPKEVDEVILGQVLQGGVGQAPARQAALFAGIPDTASAWTVNKVCSSGLRAIMSASQAVSLGEAKIMLAGGMENMSLAPYILDRARSGYRLGNGTINDLMITDGLWDPHNNIHMGSCAEKCAKEFKITREEQDEFAAESYRRAIASIKDGKFKSEIVPVIIKGRKGEVSVDTDKSRAT